MRGKFITIEGTEGVGKTTNIQFIQNWPICAPVNPVVHRWRNRFENCYWRRGRSWSVILQNCY